MYRQIDEPDVLPNAPDSNNLKKHMNQKRIANHEENNPMYFPDGFGLCFGPLLDGPC